MKYFVCLAALKKRSLVTILFLGFSSGLPLALTGATLQAWFTVANISVVTIGWLTLVGQPYTYKFLWAPLFDRYALPFLGRRRGWMLVMQISLVITIAALGCMNPQHDLWLICLLAVLISFFSATQDIVVDAYRTEILQEQQQGMGSALFVTSYRIAMLVSGGMALILADKIGWQITYFMIAALMLIGVMATLFAIEPLLEVATFSTSTAFMKTFSEPLTEFWQRSQVIAILSFIILYKLGEAFAVALSSTFLLKGVGFSLTDIGVIYKTVGLVATLLGASVSGILLAYINLYRGLLFFGILQALAILFYVWLALVGKNYLLMVSAIFAENFCAGMATSAFMVFLMRLCNQRYTAAQYALFAALSAVARVFVGPVAGAFAAHYSWPNYFLLAFALTLPGLLILSYLNSKSLFRSI